MSRDVLFSTEAGCARSKHAGEHFVSACGRAIEAPFASDAERGFECERPAGRRRGFPKWHGRRRARP
ncbi:hypothetical protein [Burkholderia sp. JP2-270]|uniref:hypothetical protein n=1 Tax=Burkholderia sp. JP2-270 TaxID=2217913 RepID=UPI0013A697B6|nr:hypothetical protein [Burkholderia sp. JP2-270]